MVRSFANESDALGRYMMDHTVRRGPHYSGLKNIIPWLSA